MAAPKKMDAEDRREMKAGQKPSAAEERRESGGGKITAKAKQGPTLRAKGTKPGSR